MLSLLMKDAFVLKKQFLLALIYMVFMSFLLTYSLGPLFVPVLTVAVTYLLVFQSCTLDDKSNSELALLSLPLLREEIVQAKYLTLFLFAVPGFLWLLAVQWILVSLGYSSGTYITWVTFAITLLAVSLMGSIYYPFYFKLGYIKSKVVSILTFFTFFFSPGLILGFLKHPEQYPFMKTLVEFFQWLSTQSDFTLSVSALLLAALFCTASYFLSLRFYERREF